MNKSIIGLIILILFPLLLFNSSCKKVDPAVFFTLTVTKSLGLNGTPESGAYSYSKDTVINYSYSLQSGYENLVVKLDGATVGASGSITMSSDHTLSVSATPVGTSYTYALTVNLGAGTTGIPSSSGSYTQDSIVSYNYSLQSGYKDLVVKLDGATVAASGSVTMNADHTLSVSATPDGNSYTLTVNLWAGATGTPSSSGAYAQGSTVNYSYSLEPEYKDLVVKLDGATVAASGSVTMNSDHTLNISATTIIDSFTLTVNMLPVVNYLYLGVEFIP
jgi:hypothetical protein